MSKFDALPNVADDLDFYLRKLAAAKRKLQTANNFLEASQVCRVVMLRVVVIYSNWDMAN
jgi:hypothetical protein